MLQSTLDWWALLRGVAAFNVLAWLAVAAWMWRTRASVPADIRSQRRWQLALSAGYVVGCAWRSLLPVYDVPRLVLVDSFWSSVIVGRSVATVAELCFAAQWALALRLVSRGADSRAARWVSRAVLPLIAAAEVFSWYSVLTTSNLGHVVEEGLWGGVAALLVASLALAWPQAERACRPLLVCWGAAALAYAAYMFGVDVPMYWARWATDADAGRATLSVAEGLVDASTRWVVSHRWEDWRGEVVWMTAYFSIAVWMSLALVSMPALLRWRGASWPLRTASASVR